MSALPSKTGEVPRAYPEIRWRHSGRAATLSASRKNGQRRTPTTFLLMPNMAHSKSYLAFDFGAESGRVILAHLHWEFSRPKKCTDFRMSPSNTGAHFIGTPLVSGSKCVRL